MSARGTGCPGHAVVLALAPSSKRTRWPCRNSTGWQGSYQMPAPRRNCTARSPNCPLDSSEDSAACMPQAHLRSAFSPGSSQSQCQPSIAHSIGVIPLSVRFCPLTESTRGSHGQSVPGYQGVVQVSMAPRNWATGAPESCTTCPMTGGRRQVE